jgi:DNA-directed RNA polymerase beta'' subunit
LRQLLAWSFTNYDSMQACALADELKYLGFKYASQAGISISVEDLKIPFVKNLMLKKANQEIINAEKIYVKGKITEVERFQKIIDTWSLTSEFLKDQVVYYFKNYDPLNSVYIMAFSGARGNLSQVRQLVGMRGLMSDPSGQIMNLPIKKNFREGLTITDYLMSGYGARKGIVDTALKTANSGYLTRRLIDVAQDILIREKDCLTTHSLLISKSSIKENLTDSIYNKLLGRVLNKPIFDSESKTLLVTANIQITPKLIEKFKQKQIREFYIRSPLTCNLYRAICQKCYGWDLATENIVDIGEAVGILAGQSIGEPGTQLTMRTFHTGGIFTSETRQQLISPLNGIVKFDKMLNTIILRTNRGEDVLVTKNSGSLIIIPDNYKQNLIEIEILRNTILFPKNNQYILKDTVIGELININKQIKTEIKPILSNSCGEIFIPQLKKKVNLLNNNKLIWLLSGQLYSSPSNSFINFYPDYKLNKKSYIFRTKIIHHYSGFVEFINKKQNLYQRIIKTINKKYSLLRSSLQKIESTHNNKTCLLNFQNRKYLIKTRIINSKVYLQMNQTEQFGTLVTNSFKTLTGGILYYDHRQILKSNEVNAIISYYPRISFSKRYQAINNYRTIIWLGEEIHKVNCEQNILLVEHGDFISKGFEIIPGIFSKTSGIVLLQQKNNLIQTVIIKSGLVYEGNKVKSTAKKIYYPGEIIFSNISINRLSFCEHVVGKNNDQLLVRPIDLYEFPYLNKLSPEFQKEFNIKSQPECKVETKSVYVYKSNQFIKKTKNLELISNLLTFKINRSRTNNLSIKLLNHKKTQSVAFYITEKLQLNQYISPYLKYKNIESCFLIQKNQFIDSYTNLGYLEALTLNSLEIVKVKIKKQASKQIFLISNNDCLIIKKPKGSTKTLNDFIINTTNINEIGKIIIENNNLLTIQKGRPYFFPNCKNQELKNKTNLQYKVVSPSRIETNLNTTRFISLNYYNILKLSLRKSYSIDLELENKISIKSEFTKLFFKKNAKLYSYLVPQFFKKFTIRNDNLNLKFNKLFKLNNSNDSSLRKIDRTLLIQISDILQNKYKQSEDFQYQLTLVKFLEHPFAKVTKSIGLYSITEDYFEQDANSVFCKNSEFIEEGETIGLLNLEKELTGDIVQGLPRIEEILEARKKNIIIKRIPTSQKKGLVVQKTSLDPNFEFKKVATSVKENEKINPHKLLKVYFNYYGSIKLFLCDKLKVVQSNRLIDNYEGSYKSFKKVQLFILNSVQSVYQSQGVSINNKHLEVIIKQMTTKVLITYEGNTPLLRREVIDLYHIHHINKMIMDQKKQPAYYVPLLLGITKAALNNPSFISAASFQETTRVLTKAAIEGRIDWLRGLKENIIIGHLIPAGTGSQTYRNCFKKCLSNRELVKTTFETISNIKQKS